MVSGVKDLSGAGESWCVQGRLFVVICTSFESLEASGARTKRRGAWVSSHLEERAGKESRQKEEMTKKGC